jgi:hypothetical protein
LVAGFLDPSLATLLYAYLFLKVKLNSLVLAPPVMAAALL